MRRPRARIIQAFQSRVDFQHRVGADCDMTHFASFAAFSFAIQVDRSASYGHGDSNGAEEVHHAFFAVGAAEQVDHSRGLNTESGGSEGQVEDGTEVIFKLGSVAGFDGVVARVVGTGSDFVDEQVAWTGKVMCQ